MIDSQFSKNEIKLPIQTKYYALHDIFTCFCLFISDNWLLHAINEVVFNCTLNMVDCTETEPSSYARPWRIVVVFS